MLRYYVWTDVQSEGDEMIEILVAIGVILLVGVIFNEVLMPLMARLAVLAAGGCAIGTGLAAIAFFLFVCHIVGSVILGFL